MPHTSDWNYSLVYAVLRTRIHMKIKMDGRKMERCGIQSDSYSATD